MPSSVMNFVIVGASSGLGREVAQLLLAQGHRVGVAARRIAPLMELQHSYPDRAFPIELDVVRSDASTRLQTLIDRMGGMDVYLHCAGIGFTNPDLDVEKEMQTVATNSVGFTCLVVHAFNYFARHRRRGHLAAITSVAGTKGMGAAPAYSAGKRQQSLYLQALAQLARIRGFDIAVTDIRPGFVRTAFIEGRNFPMLMNVTEVAHAIVLALHRRQRVATIDWRYRLLVALWRLLPDRLWECLRFVR